MNKFERRSISKKKTNKAIHFLNHCEPGFFHSLYEKSKKGEIKINMDALASVLLTSYYLEEDDLHKGNIGFYITGTPKNKEYVFFKIDHDLMFSDSIMSQKDMRLANILYNKDAFKITLRDIENFPDLQDSKNHYWPTIKRYLTKGDKSYSDQQERQAFIQLKNNEEFIQAKWRILLKFIAMPDQIIHEALTKHLDPVSDLYIINTIKNSLWQRKAHLVETLMQSKEFKNYVQNTSNTKQILDELAAYGVTDEQKDEFNDQMNSIKEAIEIKSPIQRAISLNVYDFSYKSCTTEDLDCIEKKVPEIINTPNDYKNACIFIDIYEKCVMNRQTLTSNSMALFGEVHDLKKNYLAVNAISDLNSFYEAMNKIRNLNLPLKQQKNEVLFLLEHCNLKVNDLMRLKMELSKSEAAPQALKFIHQLRSELWIVRKLRGTFGQTSTSKSMLKIINQKIKTLNQENTHREKVGPSPGDLFPFSKK